MKPETLQEAIWLLLCGAPARQKRIAGLIGVEPSTVSKWASGDSRVTTETLATIEEKLGEYPVTDWLTARKPKVAA